MWHKKRKKEGLRQRCSNCGEWTNNPNRTCDACFAAPPRSFSFARTTRRTEPRSGSLSKTVEYSPPPPLIRYRRDHVRSPQSSELSGAAT
jgi:hypothetical protein